MKKQKTKLSDVLEVIHKWSKENDVIFHGSFMSFDDKGEVDEDRMICFGDKKTLEISIDDFNKLFDSEKDDFVNW